MSRSICGPWRSCTPILARPDAARTLAERAVAIDPERASNHLTAGYVASTAQRKADARKYYERALALDPSEALAWNNLGCLDLAAGEELVARQRFREALRLDPRGDRAARNMALVAPPTVEVFDFPSAVALLMSELRRGKAPLSRLCMAVVRRAIRMGSQGWRCRTPKMTVTRALLGLGAVRALAAGAWWLPHGGQRRRWRPVWQSGYWLPCLRSSTRWPSLAADHATLRGNAGSIATSNATCSSSQAALLVEETRRCDPGRIDKKDPGFMSDDLAALEQAAAALPDQRAAAPAVSRRALDAPGGHGDALLSLSGDRGGATRPTRGRCLWRARGLFDHGRYAEALDHYDRAVALDVRLADSALARPAGQGRARPARPHSPAPIRPTTTQAAKPAPPGRPCRRATSR